MPKANYRLYIAIYDDVESTKDNPLVHTDEPLYSGEAAESGLVEQEARTLRQLRLKEINDQ